MSTGKIGEIFSVTLTCCESKHSDYSESVLCCCCCDENVTKTVAHYSGLLADTELETPADEGIIPRPLVNGCIIMIYLGGGGEGPSACVFAIYCPTTKYDANPKISTISFLCILLSLFVWFCVY